jgi:hypothetical protein
MIEIRLRNGEPVASPFMCPPGRGPFKDLAKT